jgi:hypothetical protein
MKLTTLVDLVPRLTPPCVLMACTERSVLLPLPVCCCYSSREVCTRSDTKVTKLTLQLFIYIIQKIICDHPQSSPLLSLNAAAYDAATIATVQSNGADHFL